MSVKPATSPSRSVKTHEQMAQLNAMKRALAAARESAGEGAFAEVRQLEQLIAQIEAGRWEKDDSYKRLCEKWAAREQQQANRDHELLQCLNADDKKRAELLREVRRGRMDIIVERSEKLHNRTVESDQRVREKANQRKKKLLEVSQQRCKRLEQIEAAKQAQIKEQLKQREAQHHCRDAKVASIGRLQEEKEARLESELAEKERIAQERREKVTRIRTERAEQTEKQRREVSQRCDTIQDGDRRQRELSTQIDMREKRIARFRAEQMDTLRDRMKTYDEKNDKKEQKLQQKADATLRTLTAYEKKRHEAEKRVTQNLQRIQQSHEEKVKERELKRRKMHLQAREKILSQEEEKKHRLMMKDVEAADRILGRLEDMNCSPKTLRLPLINGMANTVMHNTIPSHA